jgi:hypothetical protein
MGEDGVNLILAIEDAFQIRISGEEVSNAYTVGELHNLIVSKLATRDSKRCLTSAAFYRTRRGMVEALEIDLRKVRPTTPLAEILPKKGRRTHWRSVQAAMKLKLPDLQHPGWITVGLLGLGIALTVALGVRGGVGYGLIALLGFLGLVVGGFLIRLSSFLAVGFPNRNTTVGDLSRDVLAVNHARLVDETGSWNEKEAWDALCRLIIIQTGVPREKIKPEASLVDDLRID